MTQSTNPSEVAPPPAPSSTDRVLDHVDNALDPEKDDKETIDRFKSPYVRKAFTAFIAMFFLIVVTYILSFILQIPLPESKILEKIIDSIIEMMKILVP